MYTHKNVRHGAKLYQANRLITLDPPPFPPVRYAHAYLVAVVDLPLRGPGRLLARRRLPQHGIAEHLVFHESDAISTTIGPSACGCELGKPDEKESKTSWFTHRQNEDLRHRLTSSTGCN